VLLTGDLEEGGLDELLAESHRGGARCCWLRIMEAARSQPLEIIRWAAPTLVVRQ